jgi:DNA-binding protein HU-beta
LNFSTSVENQYITRHVIDSGTLLPYHPDSRPSSCFTPAARRRPGTPVLESTFPGADCVIKLDIINEVVNKTGITKTKAEQAVETVFESMKRALTQGDRIELRGFGVFNVRPRKTGIGRNPRTGAEVSIPPGKAVRFKPGKELQSIDS